MILRDQKCLKIVIFSKFVLALLDFSLLLKSNQEKKQKNGTKNKAKKLRAMILDGAKEKVSILLSKSLPIYMVTFWSKYLEKGPFDSSPIIISQIGCTNNIFANYTWKESI